MSRVAGFDGPDTPRYKVVQGHFYPLVLHFEQDLTKIAAKLFEKKLITITDFEQASNSNQPSFDQSSTLLRKVLKKIYLKQRWYDVFISVLHGISELADITGEVETALKQEEASPSIFPSRSYPVQKPKEHARRHSDSDVIQSRPEHAAEADSGVLQGSFFVAGDEFPEEADESVFGSEQVHDSASSTIAEASELTKAEFVSPLPKSSRAASALAFSCASTSGKAENLNRDKVPKLGSDLDSSKSTDGDISLESQDMPFPMQQSSSDGVPPPDVSPFQNSNAWNREAENKYLKSQAETQDSEISDLKKTIETLKEEQASASQKIKEQGMVVSRKDGVIANLKKECKKKDRRVEGLKKDKAEMERKIEDLEGRCSEAEKKSKDDIELVHKSYWTQLDKLQKNLEEVQSREQIAQIDLANAKAKLSDAQLEKEREISKLKEEFYKLKLSKRYLEEEKKVEAALKERELALKDKEIALKDKELAMKEKELLSKEKEVAEEKEKQAQDAANFAKKEAERAEQEAASAKEETKHEKEGRRKSELRVRELEEGLVKLRLLTK